MGQWEIYSFLKKHRGKWFIIRQLAEHLGSSPGSVASCVRRLQRVDLLACKTVTWESKTTRTAREISAYRYKKQGSAGAAR